MRDTIKRGIMGAAFFIVLAAGLSLVKFPPPGADTETNGERWARMCKIEASNNKRDQEECISKHALGFVFDQNRADYQRRLEAAR